MSPAPRIRGTAKFARPANAGITDRKIIGAATSSATRTIGGVSRMGCQFPHQRSTTTMPRPIAPSRTLIQAARIQPAPRSSRRAVLRVGGVGACTSWPGTVEVTCSASSLLARLDQVLHQRVELLLRQARERRHDVLRVALLRVRARVDDRLADEGAERLARG